MDQGDLRDAAVPVLCCVPEDAENWFVYVSVLLNLNAIVTLSLDPLGG
jgi:hypothetical protein